MEKEKGQRDQKNFTPLPGVRQIVAHCARDVNIPSRGRDSVVINAAILAFWALPQRERRKLLRKVLVADKPVRMPPDSS